jgi:hypothetical protein
VTAFLHAATAVVGSIVLASTPAQSAEPVESLTALMFYVTDTDGSETPERVNAAGADTERAMPSLRKAFPARNYFLLGKDTAPVSRKYSIWLKPSPQFPLQIENTGRTSDGGLALYWILWQKEPLPTKDRELVKSNTILRRDTPIIIGGPKWRQGRLVFIVRIE